MKIVSQLDADGYFVGEATADESPLEPGVFLIPGGAVDTEPPKEFPGQRCKWTGSKWAYEDIPAPPPPPEPAPFPTPQEICKAKAKYLLAESDWSQLPDVALTLKNVAAFTDYRAELRALMMSPVDNPVWPVTPDAEWSE